MTSDAERIAELEREVARLRRRADAGREDLRDHWDAWMLVRQAIEELGPVGALEFDEIGDPTPDRQARQIIAAIQKIAEQAKPAASS